MALEGTLRDFSLADIFQLIGLQRKTGVLTLRGKDETVTVTILDGPAGDPDWGFDAEVDLAASDEEGHAVLRLIDAGRKD